MTDKRRGLISKLIGRFPEPLQPHLRESSQRLLSIRSPKEALRAAEDEYEHLLRVAIVPFVMQRQLLQSPRKAMAFS